MSDDTAEALRQEQAIDDAFYAELRKRASDKRKWDAISNAIELGIMDGGHTVTAFIMTSCWGCAIGRACMELDQL